MDYFKWRLRAAVASMQLQRNRGGEWRADVTQQTPRFRCSCIEAARSSRYGAGAQGVNRGGDVSGAARAGLRASGERGAIQSEQTTPSRALSPYKKSVSTKSCYSSDPSPAYRLLAMILALVTKEDASPRTKASSADSHNAAKSTPSASFQKLAPTGGGWLLNSLLASPQHSE